MRLNWRATLPHFEAHLQPILDALPELMVGERLVHRPRGNARFEPLLTASWGDMRFMASQPIIYVEHGAGQAYLGDAKARRHGSYSGGADSHRSYNVIGYIAPSKTVADRWGKPAAAVGCPKMDRWIHLQGPTPWTNSRTVAWTWHWRCMICPETQPAWPHYADAMPTIVQRFRAQGWKVLGHGHPRDDHARKRWESLGVEWVATDEEVFERASLLIADNTSLLYEFASLGRPVIALNAPWYRKDVEHGLRFWSHVPGMQIDTPERLWDLDLDAYVASPEVEMLRERAVTEAYASVDGHAAARAASFIVDLMEGYGSL